MMLLAYPAVCLSAKYKKNYSQYINCFVKKKLMATILILLVPVVNIGWFSIQTTMFVDFIQVHIGKRLPIFTVVIVLMSYIFALGVTKFDYSWLKNAGTVGMIFLFTMLVTNLTLDSNIQYGYLRFESILSYTVQILGTWIFSSVTCIMDITSQVDNGKKGFKYIVLATFLTNILLVVFGYLIRISMEDFVSISALNLVAILVAIWTTNDSNFYSTMCSLEEKGISKKTVFVFVPLFSSIISIFLVGNFETHLVQWLSLMSWIGIPMGIAWWVLYVRDRG